MPWSRTSPMDQKIRFIADHQRRFFSLSALDGKVRQHLPDITPASPPAHTVGSVDGDGLGWQYATHRRLFYRWRDGVGIEERSFPR